MIRVLCFILLFTCRALLWANDTIPESQAMNFTAPSVYDLGQEKSQDKFQLDVFKKAQLSELAAASERINEVRKKWQSMFDVKLKENHLVELRIANNEEHGYQLKLRNNLLLIGLGTALAVIVIVLMGIIWRKKVLKLRALQMSRAAFDAREEEKLRFSRELHDNFQATLSIIHIMAAHEFTKDPENRNYEMITKNTKTAISEIRSISKELYPSEIKTLGLLESLQSLIDRTNARQTETHFRLYGDDFECTSALCMTWFRIVQKLMKNTLNVSSASAVSMTFMTKPNGIDLVYTETQFDQKGVPTEKELGFVREFIQSLGGKFTFNRSINEDCVFVVFFEGK
jgi:signal transduction histidine kinase